MSKETNDSVIVIAEEKLRKISSMIKLKGRQILTNYPITAPQFIALQWIVEQEELTIGELSKKIGLAFSTTTDLVDRMEKNGLVKRVKDKNDKRVVRLYVLNKGEAIIKEVIYQRQQYLGEVLKSFTEDETEQLIERLIKLYEQMEQIDVKQQH